MKNGIAGHARPAMGGGLGAGKLRMLSSGVVLLALSCAPMPGEEGAVGQQASEIINGTTPALSFAAPFGVVRLNLFSGGICSGTIVNASYILTAAHCWAGSIPYQNGLSVSTILYEDGSPTGQVRRSDSFNVITIPWPGGACGDVTLVHLSQPLNIQNANNPDAPFSRNMYSGTIQSLVGQTANVFGYGITQPGFFDNSNPPACSTVATSGSLRQALLPITSVFNPPVGSCGGYSFYMGPNSANPRQSLGPGDSGAGALIGPPGFETLAGVASQGNCAIDSSLVGGPVIFRDGVMNIVGAHNSPKAFYAIPNTGGALTEYWHIGQASRTGNWIWNQVGSGWSFREVAQDGSILYAVDSAGNVRWYRHDGHYDIYGGHWGARSGTIIQSGFNVRHVLAGGNGVLYTVDALGNMRWYRHNARHVGQFGNVNVGQPDWTVGNIIRNLSQYSHITTAGDGIFYLRESNGNVYWMRYNNHLTGAVGGFTSPVYLMNIPGVKDLVARPDGYLYYSENASSGILYQAKHLGYLTGANSWATPSGSSSTPHFASVGSGWNNLHILGSSPAL